AIECERHTCAVSPKSLGHPSANREDDRGSAPPITGSLGTLFFILPPSSFILSLMFPGIARVPIVMPQLGESIAEATIVRLPFAVGDDVQGDAEIIEVETNKATMGVTAPCSG